MEVYPSNPGPINPPAVYPPIVNAPPAVNQPPKVDPSPAVNPPVVGNNQPNPPIGPNPAKACPQVKLDSIDCGFFGITEQQCIAKNCCFMPNKDNLPVCYQNIAIVPIGAISNEVGEIVNVKNGVPAPIPDLIPTVNLPTAPPNQDQPVQPTSSSFRLALNLWTIIAVLFT